MYTAKSALFEPTRIKSLELRNRFVRSATYDGCAEQGYVTEKQMNLSQLLPKGGGADYQREYGCSSKWSDFEISEFYLEL